MNPTTFYNNFPGISIPPVINRPRFYDDLEPMNANQFSNHTEMDSYRFQNATTLIIEDDLICGSEEPQKKLKIQENKGVIVASRKNPVEVPKVTVNSTKSLLDKSSASQEVVILDDDEAESQNDDDCMIIENVIQSKEADPLVLQEDVSSIYAALAKKRIEEQYRRAIEYRQRQYFQALRMKKYMCLMAYQNRMQGFMAEQRLGTIGKLDQVDDSKIMRQKLEERVQSTSDDLHFTDQPTSASSSLSQTIPLDKESGFKDCSYQDVQNTTTGKNRGRKRGRPRKYPLQAGTVNDPNTVSQIKNKKSEKKPQLIETMVGEEFQVQLPLYLLNNKKQNISKRATKPIWNPDLVQKDTLDIFLADLSRVVRQEAPKEEVALQLLKSHRMDTTQTLEEVRKNKQLYIKTFEIVIQNSSELKV